MNRPPAHPLIGFGTVRHTRLQPRRHAFAYRSYFLLLPLRSMQQDGAGALPYNRPGLISFFDADHGDGHRPEAGGALAWLQELLAAHGITDADGEIWLQCFPRVLGYTFKPVSFWYCERADGSLRAIVAEVNNTFGERHSYVIDQPRYGHTSQCDKVFHVSPFFPLRGHYQFRFGYHASRQQRLARIDLIDANGTQLQTSLEGRLQPLTHASLRHAFWAYPVLTWMVIARIHWHALRLWLKKVPFFSHPAPTAP